MPRPADIEAEFRAFHLCTLLAQHGKFAESRLQFYTSLQVQRCCLGPLQGPVPPNSGAAIPIMSQSVITPSCCVCNTIEALAPLPSTSQTAHRILTVPAANKLFRDPLSLLFKQLGTSDGLSSIF